MAKPAKIAIVGAGPAGASLAIKLARQGFEITLIDKDSFPRHKLCGEFISPECLEHFEDLGIKSDLLAMGGDRITETRFFSSGGKSVAVPTEWFGKGKFALSLSRAEMDHALWRAAIGAGVRAIGGARVIGTELTNETVTSLELRHIDGTRSEIEADIFIDASGRAAALTRLTDSSREPVKSSPNLLGFKSHLLNATSQPGICEIYFFEGGYGGLSHVEGGNANFCFLVKTSLARQFIGNTNKLFRHVLLGNTRAAVRMADATPVHDWLAVKVDRFGAWNTSEAGNLIAVGDAGAFIDPFTGSGILMALESANLAADSLTSDQFSPAAYYFAHRRLFRHRLAVSSILRRAAMSHVIAAGAIGLAGLSEIFRELLARATRPRDDAV